MWGVLCLGTRRNICVYMYETVCVLSVGMWVLLVPRDSLCLAGCGTHRGRGVRPPPQLQLSQPVLRGPQEGGAAMSALQGWGVAGPIASNGLGEDGQPRLAHPQGSHGCRGLSLGETGQEGQEEG